MQHPQHPQNHRPQPALTVRTLEDRDRPALTQLAQRDSASSPPLPLLGAELNGELVAAVSILEPRRPAIADPFLPTASTVSILRLRASQLRGEHGADRRRGLLPQLRAGARTPARR